MLIVGLVSFSFGDNSHYYDYVIKGKYMKKLCFNFEKSYDNPEWEQALIGALNTYNNEFRYNTVINFVYMRSSIADCSYTVQIETEYNDNANDDYDAVTTGRNSWYRQPFDKIKINLANTSRLYSYNMKKALIMHEVSHVIGLKHKGYGWGAKVPNTSNDPHPENSVTNGGASDYLYDHIAPQEYSYNFLNMIKKL